VLKPIEQEILEVKIMTSQQITALFKEEIGIWKPVVGNFQSRKK
jgi:hypothetical protein